MKANIDANIRNYVNAVVNRAERNIVNFSAESMSTKEVSDGVTKIYPNTVAKTITCETIADNQYKTVTINPAEGNITLKNGIISGISDSTGEDSTIALSQRALIDFQQELDNKADKDHTHTEYALVDHTHEQYADKDHTHEQYADKDHTHDNYISGSELYNYSSSTEITNESPNSFVTYVIYNWGVKLTNTLLQHEKLGTYQGLKVQFDDSYCLYYHDDSDPMFKVEIVGSNVTALEGSYGVITAKKEIDGVVYIRYEPVEFVVKNLYNGAEIKLFHYTSETDWETQTLTVTIEENKEAKFAEKDHKHSLSDISEDDLYDKIPNKEIGSSGEEVCTYELSGDDLFITFKYALQQVVGCEQKVQCGSHHQLQMEYRQRS